MRNKGEHNTQLPEFEKHIPTALIVDTPFQVLCALEAIKEFEIEEYLIVALLDGEERDKQMLKMLEETHVRYESFTLYDYKAMLQDFLQGKGVFATKERGMYNRVMLGDFYSLEQREVGYLYATQHAMISYMDDGSSSIMLLNGSVVRGEPSEWYEKRKWRLNEYQPTIAARRVIQNKWGDKDLSCRNCIYTLFADIQSKNFITYPNTFSHLFSPEYNQCDAGSIYILGAVASTFSQNMGISIPMYESLLRQKISEIRTQFPKAVIRYIPHGRDTSEVTKVLCNELDVEYQRLDCSVEYYFMREKICPSHIYGWGTTALYTLHKMLPHSIITNWYIDNPQSNCYHDYRALTQYYEQHDIKTDTIRFPALPIRKRIGRSIKYILRGLRIRK